MPDAVSGVNNAAPVYGPGTQTVDRPDQMGKDAFLKLLVAQLRYQDPMNPASNTETMAQTASFSQVEKQEEMLGVLKAALESQVSGAAASMTGKYVTYTSETGEQVTGRVDKVSFGGMETMLSINGKDVPQGRMVSISDRPPVI